MDKQKIKYYKPSLFTINILMAKYFGNYINWLTPIIIDEINSFKENNNEEKLDEEYIKKLHSHIKSNKYKLITDKTLRKIYKE